MMKTYTLAIDLGGSRTKIGLLSKNLELAAEMIVPTQVALGAEGAAHAWLEAISEWRKEYTIDLVGMGSPGPLDTEKGCILETPNLKNWSHFSFTEFFRKNLGVPAYIENDANCAALGEWWHDNKVPDLVMLTLGTGVGSGVISGGRLIRGVQGLGVEAGHMVIDMKGPLCGCGKHGCFEAFVGARSLSLRYNERSRDKVTESDAYEIFQRAQKSDAVAVELTQIWTHALAVGIGNLINIFNPSLVTLTGGVSRAFPLVEERFRKILLTEAFEPSLKCAKILVSQLQEKAGIYGAAIWAQQQRG